MKKIHIALLILGLIAIITYEYNESVQYQKAFNQSMKIHLENISTLIGQNRNLINQFDEKGSLNKLQYQTLKDNQASITSLFQQLESIEHFKIQSTDEVKGVLRSYQSTYIEDLFLLFDYEIDDHKDSTDETIMGYYSKLSNELSDLLMKKDSVSWHQEVKKFLHSGSTFILPNN